MCKRKRCKYCDLYYEDDYEFKKKCPRSYESNSVSNTVALTIIFNAFMIMIYGILK